MVGLPSAALETSRPPQDLRKGYSASEPDGLHPAFLFFNEIGMLRGVPGRRAFYTNSFFRKAPEKDRTQLYS